MRKEEKKENGSMTLETSIVLPIFIFIFMFIYSIFGIVSAQNQITHALVQASKSLSLDSYLYDDTELAGETATNFWGGFSDMVIDLVRISKDKHFVSQVDWYNFDTINSSVIKNRFVGFLSGGDEKKAEEKLKSLKVIDGLNGITFSAEKDGDDLIITIKYELQYWFDFFDMGKIPMKQEIKTRLWA